MPFQIKPGEEGAKDEVPDDAWKEGMTAGFAKCQERLTAAMPLETERSGTTATLILTDGRRVRCAYVGDSTAILAHRSPGMEKFEKITPLSKDHKPDAPAEAERILKAGGEVKPAEGGAPSRLMTKDYGLLLMLRPPFFPLCRFDTHGKK